MKTKHFSQLKNFILMKENKISGRNKRPRISYTDPSFYASTPARPVCIWQQGVIDMVNNAKQPDKAVSTQEVVYNINDKLIQSILGGRK